MKMVAYLQLFLTFAVLHSTVCKFADWTSWSACSVKCGIGSSMRERVHRRQGCYTELTEKKICNQTCNRGTNVAYKKNVTSSSIFLSSYPNANAVDGNENGSLVDGRSCAMTNKDARPFFRIDLGGIFAIKEVVVYNRIDCCSERLNNFVVTVNHIAHGVNRSQVCGGQGIMEDIPSARIPCLQHTIGNFVEIQIPGPQFLSLCEIKVFGDKAVWKDVARGKSATQSTTTSNNANYGAGKALDGQFGTYTHTSQGTNQWWKVDLGKTFFIYKVRVYAYNSGGSYLTGFEMAIGNEVDTTTINSRIEGSPTLFNSNYQYEFVYKNGVMAKTIRVSKAAADDLLMRAFEAYSYVIEG